MKAKYLLTALALPAMFAACSQEDVLSNENMLQSTEVLGKIAGDVAFTFGPESRLVWGATGEQAWESNDEFSLFWVNSGKAAVTEATSLDGMANALYKKDGDTFTSENILYVGKHIMVYPVDKAHFSNKDILVKVASKATDADYATQDGSIALGKRSVYVNDSLLTIDAMPEDAEDMVDGVIYAAGYKQPVQAMVKPLSSNLVLNLNFDMPATISEVTVKSVSVVADKAIFPADGYLTATNDSVGFSGKTMVNEIKLNMPSETKVTKDENTYTAQLAMLPILSNDATKYQIKVATNYGVVTIDSAKYVTDKNGLYLSAGNTTEAQAAEGFKIGKAALNLADEFALTKENGSAYTYRGKKITATKEQESFGKRITANVKVMMNEASIKDMKVTNSQELIDAYTTYTLLAKTDAESFILSNKKPFELTPEAVATILANNKVTLTQEENDTIKLIGAHTAIPSFIVKNGNSNVTLFNTANTKLVLGAEGTWALDVDAAAAANTWKEVINAGTLTISESNPTTGAVALSTPVTNLATVAFGSNVDMPVAYKQIKDATTTVATAYVVNLNGGANISGKVDVDGTLVANRNVVNLNKDAEVAVSGSFLTASTGTMHNLGTIKLETDKASTIVSTNENGTDMGSIVVYKRNSNAKVNNKSAQGYIKWACDVETYVKNVSDVFNTLILSDDFKASSLDAVIKYIEIAGSKVNIYTSSASALTLNLTNVVVNENSTLVVPKATTINVTGKTVNDGRIEVYGAYVTAEETGKGTIYYYNGQVNVANAADLQAVINNAANNNTELIVLTEDIELTAPLSFEAPAARAANAYALTLNLNGNKIINKNAVLGALGQVSNVTAAAGIYVNNPNLTLTIKGEGEVSVDANAHYQSAVWVANGTVIIEGGKYYVGKDDEGNGCTTIQGYAKPGSKESFITIKGGEFSCDPQTIGDFSVDQYTCLNLTGGNTDNANKYIKVEGGKFINFNPAVNYSEGLNTNFVSTGYVVKAYNESKKKDAAESTNSSAYDCSWSDTVSYSVIKAESAE